MMHGYGYGCMWYLNVTSSSLKKHLIFNQNVRKNKENCFILSNQRVHDTIFTIDSMRFGRFYPETEIEIKGWYKRCNTNATLRKRACFNFE